jgi:DNA polymerase (family 10)
LTYIRTNFILMDNSNIASVLGLYGKLLVLHGENEFRAKSYVQAGFIFKKISDNLASLSTEEILNHPDLSKSLSSKVPEILLTGSFEALNILMEKTPSGIVDVMKIRGLGPKKVRELWKGLHIESLGELRYACLENRLITLNGFGEKTQKQIIQELDFLEKNSQKVRYASVEYAVNELLLSLKHLDGVVDCQVAGQFRRQCQTIDKIEIVMQLDHMQALDDWAHNHGVSPEKTPDYWTFKLDNALPVFIYFPVNQTFAACLFQHTGTEQHLAFFNKNYTHVKSENDIYSLFDLPFFPPYLREFEPDKQVHLCAHKVIEMADIKGALHNHSTWSDGKNTLHEMVESCQKNGWEYMAICDHSQSASYANGLKVERVMQQWKEIDAINSSLKNFKLFSGIESDILFDGSLDYENDVLKQFDIVVASVHSQLRMDKEKAMSRLLKAIENPYTTILGHPTGRLLLSREGYPVDHHKLIDACAANGVSIELNANPYRLDLDWKYLEYAATKGVPIAINPDAHNCEGLLDMKYGVLVAQKAGIIADNVLNTMPLDTFEKYIQQKKSAR